MTPDERYMKRALSLAKKGEGMVSPNPMVGTVIVRSGKIVSEGYHRKYGGAHAEIEAIDKAREPLQGTTFYVTLEPCSHQGKTPPCVTRIIEAKPERVVIGTKDPNPMVAGKGIDALRRNGIAISMGVLAGECLRLNEKFFKFMNTGLPFVTVKYAQTLDGRIASSTGHSRWISSEKSLNFAHRLRSTHDAILVGVQTVITDDPDLTVRRVKGRNPLRIVVDSSLRIPEDAKVLRVDENAKTLVVTTSRASGKKIRNLSERGIEILQTDNSPDGRVNLKEALKKLGARNVSSLLVEGGSKIITSLLNERLADRIIMIMAPKILGAGIDAVGDLGCRTIDDSLPLNIEKTSRLGNDIIVEARPL